MFQPLCWVLGMYVDLMFAFVEFKAVPGPLFILPAADLWNLLLPIVYR